MFITVTNSLLHVPLGSNIITLKDVTISLRLAPRSPPPDVNNIERFRVSKIEYFDTLSLTNGDRFKRNTQNNPTVTKNTPPHSRPSEQSNILVRPMAQN